MHHRCSRGNIAHNTFVVKEKKKEEKERKKKKEEEEKEEGERKKKEKREKRKKEKKKKKKKKKEKKRKERKKKTLNARSCLSYNSPYSIISCISLLVIHFNITVPAFGTNLLQYNKRVASCCVYDDCQNSCIYCFKKQLMQSTLFLIAQTAVYVELKKVMESTFFLSCSRLAFHR